ncbi:GntR family transcriptional regulator [Dehalobacter sp. DCM]|uniref:GntR family transcriptional regulator n=1 Tax=Dehalobacter sp. DCM TaxID=2907827 RepID=UPI003081FCA5|nr:GntR family transcriptional regulator [Dehalobacter sp. DCM]
MGNILYIDIVNDIKNKIRNGDLKPGDIMQPEYELSAQYGVSRTTLRKSLALLLNEGFIYSIPGKGNFVCKPSGKTYQLVFDEIENLNVQIDSIQLIDVKLIPVSKKLIEKLQIVSDEKVIRVRKVYRSKEKRVEYTLIYMPYKKGNPIVEDIINFANFHNVMEKQQLHFQIAKKLNIHVVRANNQLTKHLDTHSGDPVFLITQEIVSSEDNSLLSYSEYYILSDALKLQAEAVL